MVIISRMSFWIHKYFDESIADALNQFKEQGYVEQLKTRITPETMPSDDEELLKFLYDLIIHI